MPDAHQYQAFQVAFDTWYNALCKYACSYLKDEDACEDIVQEVFTRIWQHRPDLIGTEDIRYYLFTAVRNNCISQLRKEKKNDTLGRGNGVTTTIESVEHIQDKEEREQEYMTRVQKAIEGLPPRCKYTVC